MMRRMVQCTSVILLLLLLSLVSPCRAAEPVIPEIKSLVKSNVYKRMSENREVMVYANLEGGKKYSFYATMLVNAPLASVRSTLLDYPLYPKMISYIDRADFDPKVRLLTVEGGIWKFRLSSVIRMEERGDRWLHFTIARGHFEGLQGDIFFENHSPKGTAVFFRGELSGTEWPPALVIERGAEIVFGFTGGRMRNYIESKDKPSGESRHDNEVPQPRSRF